MRVILLTTMLSLLAGCTHTITKEQWQNADFGGRLDKAAYVAYIQQSVSRSLIDPGSMRMGCNDARKGWARTDLSGQPQFGWTVLCSVNAKNQFGGYTGAKLYVYLFKGDRLLVSIPRGRAKHTQNYGYIGECQTGCRVML